MNYYEMRDMFLDLLNRTDVTPEDADRFLYLGTTRVDRRLLSFIQKTTIEIPENEDGTFTVPFDLMAFSRVEDEHGIIPRVGSTHKHERGYRVTPDGIVLGVPKESIKLTYYREFNKAIPNEDPEGDSDVTNQSAVIPDVIVYSALMFAGDKYEDARSERFEATFEKLLAEVQYMSDMVEMSGFPVIRNPYEGYI